MTQQQPQQQNGNGNVGYAKDFDAWLNEPTHTNYSGGAGFFSLKEDKQKAILIFHHDANSPPERIDGEFPDRKDPNVKRKSTRVSFNVSLWSDQDEIKIWEVSKTTAQQLWPAIRDEGQIVFEVTRNGKPNDPGTTYNFVFKSQLQKQLEGERSE